MIRERNTNSMMFRAYDHIMTWGIQEESRNGLVISIPQPVTLNYTHPMEKVNFCPVRNANPFFHFMESLWMIGGRQDVAFVAQFAKNMVNFSDDGETFNAPYGWRIRHNWNDQLHRVIAHLRKDPASRQAVVQIWDPADLNKDSRDLACNLVLVFRIINDRLNMTVFNRSNDAIWGGVSGANITNLPVFQEYVATFLGIPTGEVFVVSNNLHLYLDNPQTEQLVKKYYGALHVHPDPYETGEVEPYPLIQHRQTFDQELSWFLDNNMPNVRWDNFIFPEVAVPMYKAWTYFKAKKRDKALQQASNIVASDWRMACVNWLNRKYESKA
jgi:thymidylate synthase